jgi:hypothetical protein
MADPIEVAIQKALTDRAGAFVTAWNVANPVVPPNLLTISYPNIAFTPPAAKTEKTGNPTVYGRWLQVSILPAPTFARGVGYAASNQHYGIFQISAFMGFGSGEPATKRLAGAVAEYFKRGTVLRANGLPVTVYDTPVIAAGFKDDPWWVVPVSIPFKCFAPSP